MVKIEVYIKKRGERDRKVVWVQRVPIRGESLMVAGEGLADAEPDARCTAKAFASAGATD